MQAQIADGIVGVADGFTGAVGFSDFSAAQIVGEAGDTVGAIVDCQQITQRRPALGSNNVFGHSSLNDPSQLIEREFSAAIERVDPRNDAAFAVVFQALAQRAGSGGGYFAIFGVVGESGRDRVAIDMGQYVAGGVVSPALRIGKWRGIGLLGLPIQTIVFADDHVTACIPTGGHVPVGSYVQVAKGADVSDGV